MVEIILKVSAVLIFAVALIIFLVGVQKSKGVYDDYIAPLDEKQFKLKKYIGAGMVIKEKFNIGKIVPKTLNVIIVKYMADVRNKINELYGTEYTDYYYNVHNAQKAVLIPLAAAGLSLFSLILISQGDITEGAVMLAVVPVAAVGIPFISDHDLNSKIEDRRTAIQIEFPEFVNKLILLINAGMTISAAWAKIAADNKKKNPLYDELNQCMADIYGGKPEHIAYEEFGRRCRTKEIIRFTSVIVLNLKKGGAEVVATLRTQADECWEMRKAAAKRLGEKASSKLMLPMAMMLLGIMLIVILPAVLSLLSVG